MEKKQKNQSNICPYAKRCGGCDYQGVPYEKQLAMKQEEMQKLLGGFGKVNPIIGMKDHLYYRNKVHAVFDRDRKGNIISGVYEKNSHRVVNVDSCLIQDQRADAIILTIRKLIKDFKMKTYNEDTGYGLFRHVLIRTGHVSGQILVVLVLASPILPAKNNFIKALRVAHPEITSIVLNVNDKRTSMVLGEREIVLYGKGYIEDTLCGLTYRISPKSFYQINPVQTEKLYQTAVEYAGLTGNEVVLDAYCGIGTIGMTAASKAKEVIGVELNKDAVKDAIANAKINGIKNVRFYNKDASDFIMDMASQKAKCDVIFMDPPRSGSTEKFLDCVVALAPKRVVYISCDPNTLARDLKYITKKGYRVTRIQPVDMFVGTKHVETVILLSRKTPDAIIEIDLEMSELDLTRAESKATYKEIEEYVQNKYGLHVTNLYIAQVKREFGIIERINYNVGDGKSRVPQVTPEKREAIIDALKYFQMIEV